MSDNNIIWDTFGPPRNRSAAQQVQKASLQCTMKGYSPDKFYMMCRQILEQNIDAANAK